jgi:KUP system potassium uptake protein
MAQADAGAPHPRGPAETPSPKATSPAPGSEGAAAQPVVAPAAPITPGRFWGLVIGSIGVVYGDIGTSPLYAFRDSLARVLQDGSPAIASEIIGVVSLIFWALMLVVTIKYVILMMQMDNKGEGGTLALMALAQRAIGRRTALIFVFGVLGAALFYGDALITPAISVLSAVEGLREVPALEAGISPWVLPIGVGVLIGLFAVQSRGTALVARWFGPVMSVWFICIGALGAMHMRDNPAILAAFNPLEGALFIVDHKFLSFFVLGAVFLAVTGAEALYADMGHFGRRPIRFAWMGFVLPALTLNYFGQGAFALDHIDLVNTSYASSVRHAAGGPISFEFNPFFLMAPDMLRLPLVILATAATIIASQAVISGAFSLTQQAIQLGLLPRMEIRRTSETLAGQIFIPQVNGLLFAGVVVIALAFGTSSRLAAAYGIAVTGTMITSTLLAYVAIWKLWRRPPQVAALIVAPFVFIELIFLGSNLLRVTEGGFVPLVIAAGLAVTMWTWVRGTRLLTEQTRRDEPLAKLFETLAVHPPTRVRGTAIFLTADLEAAPAALLHNLKHNQVLHEQIIILTVKTLDQPRVPERDRVKIRDYLPDVKLLTLNFGFMETPNVVKALTASRKLGLKFDIMKTSFFLSRRTVVASDRSGMPLWQDHLFIFLARNSTNATDFFHIPSGRAVELGNQVVV